MTEIIRRCGSIVVIASGMFAFAITCNGVPLSNETRSAVGFALLLGVVFAAWNLVAGFCE
jgi:hypothetical protein